MLHVRNKIVMFTYNLQTAEAKSIQFTVYAYDSVNGPSAKVGKP